MSSSNITSNGGERLAMLASNSTKPDPKGGLSTGAIVGIIIACLFFIAIFSITAFLLYRRIQKRRKNHGEYQPQAEEAIHGKDLPNITPPNIEGLI